MSKPFEKMSDNSVIGFVHPSEHISGHLSEYHFLSTL